MQEYGREKGKADASGQKCFKAAQEQVLKVNLDIRFVRVKYMNKADCYVTITIIKSGIQVNIYNVGGKGSFCKSIKEALV